MTTILDVTLVETVIKLTTAMNSLGSNIKSHNMDGDMDGSGTIVIQVSSPIIGWNSIAKIDLPAGKWHIDGYCAFTSNYTDLALIGFGLSDSSGNGGLYPIEIPVRVGENNNQDNSQPSHPTILGYIGRTYGSEILSSGTAGSCLPIIVNVESGSFATYYLNYAILDDTSESTFVGSDLIINPLLSAIQVGTV
jgi:hypothetical protein